MRMVSLLSRTCPARRRSSAVVCPANELGVSRSEELTLWFIFGVFPFVLCVDDDAVLRLADMLLKCRYPFSSPQSLVESAGSKVGVEVHKILHHTTAGDPSRAKPCFSTMAPEKAKASQSAPNIPGKLSSNVTERSNGANGASSVLSTSDWEQQRKRDMKAVIELSNMLRTGLSPEQLEICVNLLESGKIPPRLLADFVKRARESR